ncbi:MAG: ABC transporter ATP-binding protein [Butyrivibrio sp.]|nr:ABC transporter ATP-binding protein [Butyrivibrio sp.]
MKLIISYIRRHLGIFMTSMLFLTMEAFADLLQPTFMAHIVDDGVKNADTSRIFYYGYVMLAIALGGAAAAVMRNIFASKTSQTIGMELRSDMYRKVQSLSQENIDRLQPASIITRITNDVTQVQDFINSCMRIMVKAPITCVGAIILIVLQTPQQIPIMLGILIIATVLIIANMQIGYPRFGKLQKTLDQLNNVSREFLSSIRVVKAFGAEEKEKSKFENSAGKTANANTAAMQVMAVFSPLINLTVNMGIVLLLWRSRSQNSAQIGRLMASVNYMTQVLFAMGMVTNILNTAVRAVASSGRISEILNEKPAQIKAENAYDGRISGKIDFENVSFSYAGTEREALHQITFHAAQGQTIGIIGPTGSGKSTLVSLVPRFYDATDGKILLDGQDVNRIDIKIMREQIAIVPQKALLFSGTIMDNLKWGDPEAGEQEINACAQVARADSFIREFENGYETVLGQGGVNLSGGQKQRISLARALLKKPSILILDDCTSALDAETEAAVLKGLRENIATTTVLLISQRISTVMKTDRILCMEDGEVKGFGTHEELMQDCVCYREIYHSQIGGQND